MVGPWRETGACEVEIMTGSADLRPFHRAPQAQRVPLRVLVLALLLATSSIPGLAASAARAADTPATPAISVGGNHACAIVGGGTVMCWGFNDYGELGDGTLTSSTTPVAVSKLSGATAIAAGYGHVCALLSGGTVECWGVNSSGELGNGSNTDSPTPVAVSGLSGVTSIAAGPHRTCAVVSGGAVECWGYLSNSRVPVAVRGLAGVTAVAVGDRHACALVSGGTVECWGWNDHGQMGNGTTNSSNVNVGPGAVSGLSGVTAIAAGDQHTCALISDGTVECWGGASVRPTAVEGLTGVTAIADGSGTTCALVSDGKVKCWGLVGIDASGRVSMEASATPIMIGGLDGVAVGVSTGRWGSCAALADGALKCWGAFEFDAPTYVSGLGPVSTPRSLVTGAATSATPSAQVAATPPASSGTLFQNILISALVLCVAFAGVLILLIALVWFALRRSRTNANAYAARTWPYTANGPGTDSTTQRRGIGWPSSTSTRLRLLFLGLCVTIGTGSGVALVKLPGMLSPAVPGSFSPTGHMIHGLTPKSAALLPDGRVLVVGQYPDSTYSWASIDSAEIYDPVAGRFTPTASIDEATGLHTATVLPDDRVLVTGRGATAVVLDPGTGALDSVHPMTYTDPQAAVALSDGRVLVVGSGDEVYDPGTGEFTMTGQMNAPGVTATLLRDGRVLVVGVNDVAPAEVYDPASGRFAPLASSTTPRDVQGAVSLPDGKVLVVGNSGPAYLFDPTTDTFAEKDPPTKFFGACFAPLPDGRVLFAGGWERQSPWGNLSSFQVSQASVQIYDPETGRSLPTASMQHARSGCAAVALRDGSVLVAGGDDGATAGSAEIFQLR
jgi:Regulator of chromosome condensation (RCC1) repeat